MEAAAGPLLRYELKNYAGTLVPSTISSPVQVACRIADYSRQGAATIGAVREVIQHRKIAAIIQFEDYTIESCVAEARSSVDLA